MLGEPTNDLDIDTLTIIEDHLDRWPGTLVVVSHDRYFLERVTDVTYALMGDGSCVLLPGGVEQYLERRRQRAAAPAASGTRSDDDAPSRAAQTRQARKELARIESQLDKAATRIASLHEQMADAASDYGKLARLQGELDAVQASHDELELAWLAAAEELEG